jgi:hypothetical protein
MKNAEELHHLIDQVMSNLLPLAADHNSFFINDVNLDMPVNADREILVSTIADLLKRTMDLTQNDCIRVSARSYCDSVLLNIKQAKLRSFIDVADCMEPMLPLAEKLGGCITVMNDPISGTAVALCFDNKPKAA